MSRDLWIIAATSSCDVETKSEQWLVVRPRSSNFGKSVVYQWTLLSNAALSIQPSIRATTRTTHTVYSPQQTYFLLLTLLVYQLLGVPRVPFVSLIISVLLHVPANVLIEVVERELIRQDLREQQQGVDMVLEFEWIDYNTCEPIPNLYVDIWHANSTGVYSGIAHGLLDNGNNDDETNLKTTFFRGVQATDAYGLTEFTSKFPGNYFGRAVHIHLVSNVNGTVLENGTYSPGNYTHVSQVYFDQGLIAEVYTVEPYASNPQALTPNTEDGILNGETVGSDPVMEYVWLGDRVENGIFAWKKLGVDVVPLTNLTVAATHFKEGDEMTVNDTYLDNYKPPFPPGQTTFVFPPSGTAVADEA